MNRDEILEKSRQENRGRDEMERDAAARAGQKACAVGGLVCAAIIVLETIFAGRVNVSTWSVYLAITGTMLVVKYYRLKKQRQLIFGAAELVLAVVFFVMYVLQLVR